MISLKAARLSVLLKSADHQHDALARKFHETHDLAVKNELERLLKEYGKLKEPWVFVSKAQNET